MIWHGAVFGAETGCQSSDAKSDGRPSGSGRVGPTAVWVSLANRLLAPMRELTVTKERRVEAILRARNGVGSVLAFELLQGGTAVLLVGDLVEQGEGVALPRDVVSSDAGRGLAAELVESGAAKELVAELVRTKVGVTLARYVIRSESAAEMIRTLVESSLPGIIDAEQAAELVRIPARDADVIQLARDVSRSRYGFVAAKAAIRNRTLINLIRDVAARGLGGSLASHLGLGSPVLRLVRDLEDDLLAKPEDEERAGDLDGSYMAAVAGTGLAWMAAFFAASAVLLELASAETAPGEAAEDERVSDLLDFARKRQLERPAQDGMLRDVEPLLRLIQLVIDGEELESETEAAILHWRKQPTEELHSPVEPLAIVVETYLARLLSEIEPHLPVEMYGEPAEGFPGQEIGHAAVSDAEALPLLRDEEASEKAAELADHLFDIVSPVEDPIPETTAARSFAHRVGWVGGAGLSTGAGWQVGALLTPWAAVVGALVGLLSWVYEKRPRLQGVGRLPPT